MAVWDTIELWNASSDEEKTILYTDLKSRVEVLVNLVKNHPYILCSCYDEPTTCCAKNGIKIPILIIRDLFKDFFEDEEDGD